MELTQIIEQQGKKIDQLMEMVGRLTSMVMKDKIDLVWVKEEDAADMLGLSPRMLRHHVKKKQMPWGEIEYRDTNGRNFQYSRKCLMRFKEKTVKN